MTIQGQLDKVNSTFEKMHNDFVKLNSEISNLDSKYSALILQVKEKYKGEKDKLEGEKEEVLKFYRVAKDNTSNKDLIYKGVSPQKPDFAKLNTLIYNVNINSRYDAAAYQIIDLCSAYIAYIEANIQKVEQREKAEEKNVLANKVMEEKQLVQRKAKIFSDCEQYLQGDDVNNLVAFFDRIHNDYEINQSYFNGWGNVSGSKQRVLLGYGQCFVNVPTNLSSTLKKSLGAYFDEKSRTVNCPCGFAVDASVKIFVEYTDFNEKQMKQGIQAFILNYLRYLKPSELKVSLYDNIHYNADILGPLNVFSNDKKSFIAPVGFDDADIRKNISMLVQDYRKIESKIGTQTVFEYNKTCNQEAKIPIRILIINKPQEKFTLLQGSELSYLINNAKRFGIIVVCLAKSMDGGSKGRVKDNKLLTNMADFIKIISDSEGKFYIEKGGDWVGFKLLSSVSSLPESFVSKVSAALNPPEIGTEYFKRYKPKLPVRSQGKRRPVTIPFAINDDGQVFECSFENDRFAAYINGAAGSGKSTLLHTIIAGLLMNYHPDELELWLVDFKMTELKKYAVHQPPHIKYLLLEKSEDLVFDIVDKLEEEINNRKRISSQNGWRDLSEVPTSYYMPVIFVIIDEFAQMSQILKDTRNSGVGNDYTEKLENILRVGRSYGFKFIFSSQTYSDGAEGLTESAKKQIQQRLAMKNTYQEIKDTLAISSDMINPAIQSIMNTLPPYESLFKWMTPYNELRVEHLRNMYTKGDQVDKLIDYITANMHMSANLNISDEFSFVDKHPVLIDGDEPKTFKSQTVYYGEYETQSVLDELDEGDILIYPGVPCSFKLVRPFTLINRAAENILVVGGNRDNEMSVVMSIFRSYVRTKNPIEIWTSEHSPIYKRYKSTVLSKHNINIRSSLEDICEDVDRIKKNVKKGVTDNRLILVLGYETISEELELIESDSCEEEEIAKPDVEEPESLQELMARISNLDIEEKKRLVQDYNQRVAQYEAARNATKSKTVGLYDARADIEWIVKKASSQGVHFVFCFEQGYDFINTRLGGKTFRHKIAFAMSRDDSNEIIGNKKANEIDDGVCIYTNGKDTYAMHPHLHKGVPSNGWKIDDDGKVVQI